MSFQNVLRNYREGAFSERDKGERVAEGGVLEKGRNKWKSSGFHFPGQKPNFAQVGQHHYPSVGHSDPTHQIENGKFRQEKALGANLPDQATE
jgi:hypothetical protein